MNNKGVSPVIGVMLMLVATVILAAIVSSYSGTFAPEEKTPTASFSAEASYNKGYIKLDHISGDPIYKSAIKIRVETSRPATSGYVNMSNVSFTPDPTYLKPGDTAYIYFTKSSVYGERAVFTGPDIRLSVAVGDKFRITVIDSDTGNAIWSSELILNP
ncbi:type IV pilin [Archaeoglobus neptunius]|uniref:type IV pilin n=1 Tax=Archaeoglobus neptunius TaxID=2798580 RepID=UPI0019289472|nr:type IV pilin N-terminal domain-containing protein [Archaeoglobus neptunius]